MSAALVEVDLARVEVCVEQLDTAHLAHEVLVVVQPVDPKAGTDQSGDVVQHEHGVPVKLVNLNQKIMTIEIVDEKKSIHK